MYIKVKVVAESKKESIEKLSTDAYRVCVTEKAERNMANKKMLEILSKYMGQNLNEIRIIVGHHSTSKILEVRKL